MNIDFLGNDSSDNADYQNILRPTIRRQQSNTNAAVTHFAQLNLKSTSISDTLATTAVNSNNNESVEEDDDFGEFLQSEAVYDKWELPEKHQVPVTSVVVSENACSTEVLPFSLPQPPPPASSSRPSFDIGTKPGGKIRSRQGTIVGEDALLNGHQPLKDTMANQLQNWISGTENSTPNNCMDYSESMIDIASVWESAEGLMGGSNPSTHINEIATRLCKTIPSNPQHEQTNESILSMPIPQVDLIEKSIDLLSQKCTESFYQLLPETNIAQQSYNLIWPLYSNTNSADEGADLTNAYLRLTKIIESSTTSQSQ
ncbi:hypothetical protein H4S08_004252 [Coemansia sp. RSA 1365]|nr:hypothetical protein H4S08_004252 [Coemansia sp. RSA 1365]